MRIITGKYKGRKLRVIDAPAVRPYTDRIKESVFSALGSDIIQARVLDLFAGSGSIGIECLSRGADFVHFNDFAKSSLATLKHNLKQLRIAPDCYQISQLKGETLIGQSVLDYDLIFLDPPFAYAHNELLARLSLLYFRTKPLLIFRYPAEYDLNVPAGLETKRHKQYGKSIVLFLERKDEQNRHLSGNV
jgi:16S rRNA (guanine966-N2)-methyltransferase